jgi:glycosyltransferase involved in cell wall biosynthesis
MSHVRISAVIITYNEEKNIGRCIDSLQDVVDEIIVVDSFSSDRTASICQEKQVNMVKKAWEGFSAAKNYGNSHSKGEYILSIDADEALDYKLQNSIKILKRSAFTSDAYSINRLTNYCGQWIRHCGVASRM